MSQYNCDICCDNKRITLPRYVPMSVRGNTDVMDPDANSKQFDCPQCVPKVPYRRVRAMKVVTAFPAEAYGRYQMPYERQLAARFGEYLLREGLIKFTTTGSKDFGAMEDKITVTAHVGVVAHEDVKRAGATPEVATTKAPRLPQSVTEKVRRRAKVASNAVPWKPPPAPWSPDTDATDEFDEPKDALGQRFQGLEI